MVGQAACWQPHERGWAPKAWHHVSGQWLKQFLFHFCTLQRSACNPVFKQHLFSPNAVAPIDDTIVVIAARSAVVANDTVSVTATLTASRHFAFVVLARERNLASIQVSASARLGPCRSSNTAARGRRLSQDSRFPGAAAEGVPGGVPAPGGERVGPPVHRSGRVGRSRAAGIWLPQGPAPRVPRGDKDVSSVRARAGAREGAYIRNSRADRQLQSGVKCLPSRNRTLPLPSGRADTLRALGQANRPSMPQLHRAAGRSL